MTEDLQDLKDHKDPKDPKDPEEILVHLDVLDLMDGKEPPDLLVLEELLELLDPLDHLELKDPEDQLEMLGPSQHAQLDHKDLLVRLEERVSVDQEDQPELSVLMDPKEQLDPKVAKAHKDLKDPLDHKDFLDQLEVLDQLDPKDLLDPLDLLELMDPPDLLDQLDPVDLKEIQDAVETPENHLTPFSFSITLAELLLQLEATLFLHHSIFPLQHYLEQPSISSPLPELKVHQAELRLRLTDTTGATASVSFASAGDVGKLEARIWQDSQSGRLNVLGNGYCCQPTQWVATTVSGTQIVQVSWEIQVTGTTSWTSDFVYAEWVLGGL